MKPPRLRKQRRAKLKPSDGPLARIVAEHAEAVRNGWRMVNDVWRCRARPKEIVK